AAGHGFEQDVGNSVAVPVGEHAARKTKHRRASVLLVQVRGSQGPRQAHDVVELERGDSSANLGSVLSVTADNRRGKDDAAPVENAACLNEDVEPLLRHEAAHPKDSEDAI